MPSDGPANTNTRVTLAVVKRDIEHLTAEVRQYRAEMHEQMLMQRAECRERSTDHEQRIRSLEGNNRQGFYRDIGAFAAAIGAGIFGWLTGKP